jgi:hypothetical protein
MKAILACNELLVDDGCSIIIMCSAIEKIVPVRGQGDLRRGGRINSCFIKVDMQVVDAA